MDIIRRDFLIGFGALTTVSLSGCTKEGNSTQSPDSADPTEASGEDTLSNQRTIGDSVPGVLVDETFTIPGGETKAFDFTITSDTEFTYDVSVANNVKIDMFVASTGEYVRFNQDKLIDTAVAIENTGEDSGTFEVRDGNYYLVVDNSDRFKAKPPGQLEPRSAKVDLKVTY